MMKSLNIALVILVTVTLAETIFEYMPHMYNSDGKDVETNILDDTCQVLNVTGVFLNSDPDQILNLQGQITILFKIAPHYLYLDQIAMIRQLRNRFDEYGYNALQFILVISHLGEERFQKKFESEIRLLMMDDTLDVIKETPEIKPLFHMTDNQAYVLDECGRLTYIIVPPWSHIQFPYIKAAILSTIYDFPCGHCDKEYIMQPYPGYGSYADIEKYQESVEINKEISVEETTEFNENSTETTTTDTSLETTTLSLNSTDEDDILENEFYDWEEPLPENVMPRVNVSSEQIVEFNETMINEEDENNDNYSLPLRIILPVEHLHYNSDDETYSKFNYIILNTNDQSFHGHLENDKPSEMENVLNDKDTNAQELLNGLDEQAKELYISQTGQIYQLLKEYYVKGQEESYKEVSLLDTDIIRDEPKITNMSKVTDIRRHYEYLVQWLTWQFDS